MPRTRREYLVRRARQVDNALRRALVYVASIECTLAAQHPEHSEWLLNYILDLDQARVKLFWWHAYILGGSQRDLWTPGDLGTILREAEPVPDPDGRK